MVLECEGILAADRMFIEHGCDESDIERCIKERKLFETEDFKRIGKKCQDRANELMASANQTQ